MHISHYRISAVSGNGDVGRGCLSGLGSAYVFYGPALMLEAVRLVTTEISAPDLHGLIIDL